MSGRVKKSDNIKGAKANTSGTRTSVPAESHTLNSCLDHFESLKTSVGNLAVQRMFLTGVLRAKLRTGGTGDEYEQEADRIADKVAGVNAAPVQTKPEVKSSSSSYREDEKSLRMKAGAFRAAEADAVFASDLHSIVGKGMPIPASERSFYEARFGHDLSSVRVHKGPDAEALAGSINARAFTINRDIVFGKGNYSPDTYAGRHLMSHELAHTLQQKSAVPVLRRSKLPVLDTDRSAQVLTGEGGKYPIGSRIGKPGRIGARAINYDTIDQVGKKIYKTPNALDSNIAFRLKYDAHIYVSGGWKADPKWIHLISSDGRAGWVQHQYVHYPPPDPKAKLYLVKNNEFLKNVVQDEYKGKVKIETGNDARLLVHAIAVVNKGRKGVQYDPQRGKDSIDWIRRKLLSKQELETLEIWNSINIISGTNIWLPGVDLINRLKQSGAITSGSLKHKVISGVIDYFMFNAGTLVGFFEGVWESFIGIFEGIADLFTLLKELVEKIWNGEFLEYIEGIWKSIKEGLSGLDDALKKILEEFLNKEPYDKGRAIGKIIGYIAFEVLVAYFTAGIVHSVMANQAEETV